MPNGENGDNGEFGDLEDLRDYIEDLGDDIQRIVFVDMGDGEGFVNVQYESEWTGYDLHDFDDILWGELFDFVREYDIDYDIYEGA